MHIRIVQLNIMSKTGFNCDLTKGVKRGNLLFVPFCFYSWKGVVVPPEFFMSLTRQTIDRLSKNREEEEENTITFRLKCIVIA